MELDKEEILKNIKSFLGAKNELAIKEAEHQIKIFKAILDKEVENYKNQDDGIDVKTDPKEDPKNIELLNVIKDYNENQEKEKAKKLKIENKNIEIKKSILKEFENLVNSKEKLSELATGIKEIREKWNKSATVSSKIDHNFQKEFSKLNESFNYNFNIYKELKENDLKRNFSLKNQIIHELKELNSINDIKKIQLELKLIQNKWEEIGPTFKEHWGDLKKNYWNEINSIQKTIREYYNNFKNSLKENLEAKNKLISKAKELLSEDNSDFKKTEAISKQFKKLQEDWKKIGPVPKNVNEKIWTEFRSIADDFFSKRKQTFDLEKNKLKGNYDQKHLLIEKAKNYVDNIDKDSNPELIKELQNQWKKIGHAGRFAEQKLWKKFRTHCDEFFELKNKNRKEILSKEKDNLKTKILLTEKFKKSTNTGFSDIKKFVEEFQKIGQTPRKSAGKILKDFEETVYSFTKKNKLKKEEVFQIEKALKSSFLSNSSDPDKAFIDEKNRLNRLINSTIKETTQLENNLSFFSNTKGKMFEDFEQKITNNKEKIISLKGELKNLSEAYHKK
jgi:hypothetical protein